MLGVSVDLKPGVPVETHRVERGVEMKPLKTCRSGAPLELGNEQRPDASPNRGRMDVDALHLRGCQVQLAEPESRAPLDRHEKLAGPDRLAVDARKEASGPGFDFGRRVMTGTDFADRAGVHFANGAQVGLHSPADGDHRPLSPLFHRPPRFWFRNALTSCRFRRLASRLLDLAKNPSSRESQP